MRGHGKPLSNSQRSDIAQKYADGSSGLRLSNEYSISVARVQRIATAAGVALRGQSEASRVYGCDHNFFDIIDTEAKAYWLGFIMADGCVTDRNRIKVAIAASDVGHVEKLRTALRSDHPVRITHSEGGFNPHDSAEFSIRSDALVAGLAAHGVCERKSLTATPPMLSADMTRHFWRGMVDGDGYITSTDRGGRLRWSIGLTGSLATSEAFAAFAASICGTKSTVQRNNSIWKLTVSGNTKARAVMDHLYGNAAVYLDRKMARYRSALESIAAPRRGRAKRGE
jgi:hypothetical protein